MKAKGIVHRRVFTGFWLSILMGMLMAENVLAKENWYHFEIIVFEQDRVNSELFEAKSSTIRFPRRKFELTRTAYPKSLLLINPIQFSRLNRDDLQLDSVYRHLVRRKAYKPLIHTAWMQSVKSDSASKPVVVSVPFSMRNSHPVQGYITLQRGYYLHLKVQFEFEKEGVFYLMDQRRRVRLSETHYFDHPVFGVIVYVERLTIKPATITQ
jgi:hypothetical protein